MPLFTLGSWSLLGKVRCNVEVDESPMRLVELVLIATHLADILVRKAIKREEDQGRSITCTEACGACCRQMVPVSPPEAFFVMDLLDSMQPTIRAQFMEKFKIIEEVVHRNYMIESFTDLKYTADQVLAVEREYFALQLPCPFLTDESCSIYPYRPVACRDYNVTSPPEYCKDPYAYQVEKVPMPLSFSAALSRLTARLTHTRPQLIPLSLVPYWVSKVGELRWRRWPGLELLENFMSMISTQPRGKAH